MCMELVSWRGGRGQGSDNSRSATVFSCPGALFTRRHVYFLCRERDFALFVYVLLSHIPKALRACLALTPHRVKRLVYNGLVAAVLLCITSTAFWLRCVCGCVYFCAVHHVRRARFRGISSTQPDP